MGEDLARAGVQGRDRLPGSRGVDAVPREARLQPRGVRLYDVHRELGAAARRGRRPHRRGEPERRRGAVRQSELRGPHPPTGPRELPRLAPAGGGVRPRRQDRLRSHDRTARARRRRAGVPARPVAEPGGGGRGDRGGGHRRAVRAPVRADLGRRRTMGRTPDPDRAGLRVGPGLHVRARTTLLQLDRRRVCSSAPVRRRARGSRAPGSRAPGSSSRSATRSRPTTSHRRERSARTRPPAGTSSNTASGNGTSTRTGPGAGTTR